MVAAQTQKQQINLKAALKTLRRLWRRGTFDDFDKLLSKIADCSLETAERIRETMEDLELLAYDSNGLLVWYDRGLGEVC